MATERVNCLLIGALVFCAAGLLFFIIGFSTPHWLEADERYQIQSGFKKLGLWEACFKDWTYFKDYNGKQYNGCWWIFSYEYRPIWQWLNPPWFLAIQVLMTLTLLLELVTVVLLILYVIRVFPASSNYVGLFATAIMALLSGIVTAICMVIFGTKSVVDRQWIENPDKNYLSWSFGLIVLSGFLILFGGMCLFVAGMQVRLITNYEKRPRQYGYEARPALPAY
ncbi:hypothetical protein FSP39_001046 [Pinctada imbricata]|uniref:Uncharacterized protein n=1 Tax=Pinctada imbricata TaxID=66713 RepID=A0AA88XKN8_PINIB|nr:hypothetical protein FSP39_001046 [Pinctada imbricata]